MGVNPRAYVPEGTRGSRKTRGRGRRWWFGLLALFFLSGLAGGLYFEWRYRVATRELADLRAENAELSKKIEALKKNPALYEEVARKKYGYVKKNERLIIFEKGR